MVKTYSFMANWMSDGHSCVKNFTAEISIPKGEVRENMPKVFRKQLNEILYDNGIPHEDLEEVAEPEDYALVLNYMIPFNPEVDKPTNVPSDGQLINKREKYTILFNI